MYVGAFVCMYTRRGIGIHEAMILETCDPEPSLHSSTCFGVMLFCTVNIYHSYWVNNILVNQIVPGRASYHPFKEEAR